MEKNLGQMVLPSLRSSGFCWCREVDLGSVLINPLSNSTMPGSTAQIRSSPRVNNGILVPCGISWCQWWETLQTYSWYLLDTSGQRLPLRLSDWGQTYSISSQTNKHIVCNYNRAVFVSAVGVMSVYNGCFYFFLPVCTNTIPHNSLSWHIASRAKPHTWERSAFNLAVILVLL